MDAVNEEKKDVVQGAVLRGIGCDVGTCFCVSARSKEEKINYKTQRDAFFDIENNLMSHNMLKKLNCNYIESEDKKSLFVVGEEALQMANFFNREIRRPLSKGVVSTREKEALMMIKIILHALVGDPIEPNEKLYFSSPANPLDANYNQIYHENVLKSFFTSFGYAPEAINEALAIIWSELEGENYTGLALSFGAGMVNAALAFYGISEKDHQFSVSRSGDWIDESAATAIGSTTAKITAAKESGIDLLNPKDREQTAIKIHYENLIEYVCKALEKKLNSGTLPNFPEPITVVLSGGTSKAINFEKLFEQEIKTKSLPFKIKEIRKAKDPLNAVARGCLLNALNFYG
jgi:actin-like ATPase involved in cell morphogenesis